MADGPWAARTPGQRLRGITLVGVSTTIGVKVLLTLALALVVSILRRLVITLARRTLGGVRGDVVRLGFLRTTIMEMGQPPSVAETDPAIWVNSRQYTGRLVTVTNGVILSEPVYNYTRDFPYLWGDHRADLPPGRPRRGRVDPARGALGPRRRR